MEQVKKISQEYFDSIVSENINEFEMSQSEAIQDAINQLKSQGADLSLICKFSMEERSQLIDSIKKLNELTEAIDLKNGESDESLSATESAVLLLNIIKDKFNADLSFRCLATKIQPSSNAYEIFMNFLNKLEFLPKEKKFTDNQKSFLESYIKTFDSYLCQQSDVLTSDGLKSLINFTNTDEIFPQFESHPTLLQLILKCINTSCQMNESNRQFFVENGLCENLINLIVKYKTNELILCQVCQLIRSILLDDDLRVEFGKSHEHAKYIASKLNGIDVLLTIGLEHQNMLNEEAIGNLMLTLSKLAVRNEFCQEICDKGGLKFVLHGLEEKHLKNTLLLKSSLSLLKNICNNDQVKYEATKSNAIALLKNVLLKYSNDSLICEAACSAIATLMLRNVEANEQFYALQVHPIFIQLMTTHSTKSRLIKQCCFALRNSISRNKSYGEKLLELRIETLLKNIMNDKNLQCQEEAKSVLRDLGCEIHLKELWTGAGKNLAADY